MLADIETKWPAELRADFQQYYNLDIDGMGEDYTVAHAADLAAQLPHDSRVARKANPANEWTMAEYMLSTIEYNIAFIAWSKTKDAKYNTNRPKPRKTPMEMARLRQKLENTDVIDIDKILGY